MSKSAATFAYPNVKSVLRRLLSLLITSTTSNKGGAEAAYANSPNLLTESNTMRAWTCHGRNQRELVDRLCQAKIVQTPAVRDVLYEVDRQFYVPTNSYMDAPQAIGLGQTISAPHMHAHVLEEMYPHLQRQIAKQQQQSSSTPEVKMLDVGCGSGYLTAAMGRWIRNPPCEETGDDLAPSESTILGATGKVFAIDVHRHLIDLATKNMQQADSDLLESNTVQIQLGDGWKGLPDEAPFDAIHVGAAAEELPIALVQQLKVGGVLIVPVGAQGEIQNLVKVERTADSRNSVIKETTKMNGTRRGGFVRDDYSITQLLGVRYVPLVHPENL